MSGQIRFVEVFCKATHQQHTQSPFRKLAILHAHTHAQGNTLQELCAFGHDRLAVCEDVKGKQNLLFFFLQDFV